VSDSPLSRLDDCCSNYRHQRAVANEEVVKLRRDAAMTTPVASEADNIAFSCLSSATAGPPRDVIRSSHIAAASLIEL